MKDTSGQSQQNRLDGPKDSPDGPTVSYTPEQRRMIRRGMRIWVRVATRSYMRRHAAESHAEDGFEEEG